MSDSDPGAGLRQEAHNILHNQGLLDLLENFGEPHERGSYTLDLLVRATSISA